MCIGLKNIVLAALLVFVSTSFFCQKALAVSIECETASSMISVEEIISPITDDLDKGSLLTALDTSIRYWKKQKSGMMVELCGASFSSGQIQDSLLLFKKIFSESPQQDLGENLKRNFQVCTMNGDKDILVTGYYQPTFYASLEKKKPFLHPLYGLPSDLIKRQTPGNGKNGTETGRLVDGKFEPYWSRKEIEQGLFLKGHEIAYLDDPVNAFFLHVQGSGLLQLQDGSLRSILFAGTNGLQYKSIGKLLVDEGRMPLSMVTMQSIRKYLKEHPEEQERILQHNERYIFFRLGEKNGRHGVVGSMGQELTAGRSAAFDQKCSPYGIPAFLETRKPVFSGEELSGWQPLRRFVFNQDSGAAIKGADRLDLFFGRGQEAESSAGVMKEAGKVYFFLKK